MAFQSAFGPGPTTTIDCAQSILLQNGLLSYFNGELIGRAVDFIPQCRDFLTPSKVVPLLARSTVDPTTVTVSSTSDITDPFYASKFPVMYALAATTVTSYMLVIMLFITPRSFLDGGVVYLGRRGGFTSGSTGGVNIGGRPWLQKIAAISVAISLTIASSSTFDVAQRQYASGTLNTKQLQFEVMDGTELKVIRLISDTFLWLAQAQTLIRLFPRHREKVFIKWIAFALIVLDIIFSALDSFKYNSPASSTTHPRTFVKPIPAISYLLQLSLGLLYAAWVLYYSVMKKRYAFYHPLMKNMILMAIMSIVSIIIPVVFFIMDLVNPEFTGWGDYVRWVGAAAASVVVWEWVERIEALEREEKKDGILGREIFDGDEMETSSSDYRRKRTSGSDDGFSEKHATNIYTRRCRNLMAMVAKQQRRIRRIGRKDTPPITIIAAPPRNDLPPRPPASREGSDVSAWPSRPPNAQTPISRTDTTSAASTMYAVRRPGPSEIMQRVTEHVPMPQPTVSPERTPVVTIDPGSRSPSSPRSPTPQRRDRPAIIGRSSADIDIEANILRGQDVPRRRPWKALANITNPLLPRSQSSSTRPGSSPISPTAPTTSTSVTAAATSTRDELGRWDIRGRFEDFAVSQAEKMRERFRPTNTVEELPTFEIPAPERAGVALRNVLSDDEAAQWEAETREEERRVVEAQAMEMREYEFGSQEEETVEGPPMWPGVPDRAEAMSQGSGSVRRSIDRRM